MWALYRFCFLLAIACAGWLPSFSLASNTLEECELLAHPHGIFHRGIAQGSLRIEPLSVDLAQLERTGGTGYVTIEERVFTAIAKHALEGSPWSQRVETAVYPASGFDAGRLFLLWPNLRNVIAINNSPFWSAAAETIIPQSANILFNHSGWVHHSSVSALEDLAPAMIAELAYRVPNFRLRQVLGITEGSQPARHHGLIAFDQGEGSPLQRFFYIESHTNAASIESPWWLGALAEIPFQAVLRKAAMGFFAPENIFGSQILQQLRRHGGLFLDGDGRSYQGTIVAWATEDSVGIRRARWAGLRAIETTARGFGYENLTIYELQANPNATTQP